MGKHPVGSREIPHDPAEFEKLLQLASESGSILEIGSRFGETLRRMAHSMKVKGRVVAVDLPGGKWGHEGSRAHLEGVIADLRSEGYQAKVIFGDSHDPLVVNVVRSLAPFDLIFIDGDHTYEGVKADWENYGSLGRVVAFHDIAPVNIKSGGDWVEVSKLWREIEGNKEEFISPDSILGLGILRNDPRLP